MKTPTNKERLRQIARGLTNPLDHVEVLSTIIYVSMLEDDVRNLRQTLQHVWKYFSGFEEPLDSPENNEAAANEGEAFARWHQEVCTRLKENT